MNPRVPNYIVMRELYRNYQQFKEHVQTTGNHTLEYKGLRFSFFDLGKDLKKLSQRKREAFYLNVILDLKQQDVADIMGITTVSVGQYVQDGAKKLAEIYFKED